MIATVSCGAERLLAFFGATSDVKEEAKGVLFRVDRYGFAQATRILEPYQTSIDRFSKYKAACKTGTLAGISAKDMKESIDRFRMWFESNTGVKAQVSEPRLGEFVILDETPTSLTFVNKAVAAVSVGGGEQEAVEMVGGMSIMLVKSKVIWLRLYARSNSREDFGVAKNIVKWTRAVSAANP